ARAVVDRELRGHLLLAEDLLLGLVAVLPGVRDLQRVVEARLAGHRRDERLLADDVALRRRAPVGTGRRGAALGELASREQRDADATDLRPLDEPVDDDDDAETDEQRSETAHESLRLPPRRIDRKSVG